jgi:hypothetical protein
MLIALLIGLICGQHEKVRVGTGFKSERRTYMPWIARVASRTKEKRSLV